MKGALLAVVFAALPVAGPGPGSLHLTCGGTWDYPAFSKEAMPVANETVSIDLSASQVWGVGGGPYRIEQADEAGISFSGPLDPAYGQAGKVYGVIDRVSGEVSAVAANETGGLTVIWMFKLSCRAARPKF